MPDLVLGWQSVFQDIDKQEYAHVQGFPEQLVEIA